MQVSEKILLQLQTQKYTKTPIICLEFPKKMNLHSLSYNYKHRKVRISNFTN